MERALRFGRFQPSGVPQKRGTKSCACVLCLPRPSGSGSQELYGLTLPGCVRLLPFAVTVSVSARAGGVPAPCISPRPSRRMSTIQNLRKSLVRNWRSVRSVVGDAVLGAEPAPFPSPLPPTSSGAGPVLSLRALLWTCSDPLFCERPAVYSGQLIFSLLLSQSLSWYLRKAPSDCPQGTQAQSLP